MAGLCAEIVSHTPMITSSVGNEAFVHAYCVCVYRINESNGPLLRNYAVLILSFMHHSCYSVRDKWEQQQACTSNGGVSES